MQTAVTGVVFGWVGAGNIVGIVTVYQIAYGVLFDYNRNGVPIVHWL